MIWTDVLGQVNTESVQGKEFNETEFWFCWRGSHIFKDPVRDLIRLIGSASIAHAHYDENPSGSVIGPGGWSLLSNCPGALFSMVFIFK
jgi:hypothetical protein